jgi:hypothetical protein
MKEFITYLEMKKSGISTDFVDTDFTDEAEREAERVACRVKLDLIESMISELKDYPIQCQ